MSAGDVVPFWSSGATGRPEWTSPVATGLIICTAIDGSYRNYVYIAYNGYSDFNQFAVSHRYRGSHFGWNIYPVNVTPDNISGLGDGWNAALKAVKPSWLTAVTLATISDLNAAWDALLKAAPAAYVTRWPEYTEVSNIPRTVAISSIDEYVPSFGYTGLNSASGQIEWYDNPESKQFYAKINFMMVCGVNSTFGSTGFSRAARAILLNKDNSSYLGSSSIPVLFVKTDPDYGNVLVNTYLYYHDAEYDNHQHFIEAVKSVGTDSQTLYIQFNLNPVSA